MQLCIYMGIYKGSLLRVSILNTLESISLFCYSSYSYIGIYFHMVSSYCINLLSKKDTE